jgi:hypothetical protein
MEVFIVSLWIDLGIHLPSLKKERKRVTTKSDVSFSFGLAENHFLAVYIQLVTFQQKFSPLALKNSTRWQLRRRSGNTKGMGKGNE